jgi:predicted secreted Zn-dependent protease
LALTTTITTWLPRWIAPTNAAPGLREAWERYFAGLSEHEAGHARIALAAGVEIGKRTLEIGGQPDRESLRQKINEVALQIVNDHRQQETEYDQRTRHGATQGAVLRGFRRAAVRPPTADSSCAGSARPARKKCKIKLEKLFPI